MATMHVRFALLAIVIAGVYGCATEPEQKQDGTAAASQAQSSRDYRTGSRLPTMEDDPRPVSGMSKDDYMDDRNRGGTSGVRGN